MGADPTEKVAATPVVGEPAPFGQLAQILCRAGIDTSFQDLRDVVWLAHHLTVPLETKAEAQRPAATGASKPPEGTSDEGPTTPEPPTDTGDEPGHGPPTYSDTGDGLPASTDRAQRIWVGSAPLLPDARGLRRAFRPVLQRQPKGPWDLDLEASVDATATAGQLRLAWNLRRRRWYSLSVVVEDVPTLGAVWHASVQALLRLLRQEGLSALHVRTLTSSRGDMCLQDAAGRLIPRARHIDRDGRHLMWLVSDCTSAAWHDGTIGRWLKRIGNEIPVALLPLLPRTLWRHTALGFVDWAVRSRQPAQANARLALVPPDWAEADEELERATVVPVLALEATWAAAWARMFMARNGTLAPAALICTERSEDVPEQREHADAGLSTEAVLTRFRSFASPAAVRLAAYLATTSPLTPPVMRLIQRTMMPEGRDQELAEVMLGGLLRMAPTQCKVAADQQPYVMDNGLRSLLRSCLTREDQRLIAAALNRHLIETQDRPQGTTTSFSALRPDPDGTANLPRGAAPFATPPGNAVQAPATRAAASADGPEPNADHASGSPSTTLDRQAPRRAPNQEQVAETVIEPVVNARLAEAAESVDWVGSVGGRPYRHSVYMSYARDDDELWAGWISHFNEELNRSLPSRLRDLPCPVPATHFSTSNGPTHDPLGPALREAVESAFAMIVFVHDGYLRSGWCLKEIEYFRELHGIWGLRDRLFIVAMSKRAIDDLSGRPAWKALFPEPEPVWMAFHQGPEGEPDQPILQFLTRRNDQAVMASDFLTPFFRLREALVRTIRRATDEDPDLFVIEQQPKATPQPKVRNSPEAVLLIESEPGREGYWEPLGLQISEAWKRMSALDAVEPPLPLRPTGLPLHDLHNRPSLDDADGVILLWDAKTPESLLAQIELVEPRLSQQKLLPPGLIAYLTDVERGQATTAPRSLRGWPVVRFATRRQDPATATVVEDDVDRLNRYLRQVQKHKLDLIAPRGQGSR